MTSAGAGPGRVTIYRAPHRARRPAARPRLAERLRADQRDPAGRRSRPASRDIRFEGVAGGILPQSAIVTGLPDGIVERNRDAYLLSPGQPARPLARPPRPPAPHLARDRRGARAGRDHPQRRRRRRRAADRRRASRRCAAPACANPGLRRGARRASPPGRPCRCAPASAQPVTATVTLSYLAERLRLAGQLCRHALARRRQLDLFAWLTLASMDETSFANADTQAVAGRLNRDRDERRGSHAEDAAGSSCAAGPHGTTGSSRAQVVRPTGPASGTGPAPRTSDRRRRARAQLASDDDDIVVTGDARQAGGSGRPQALPHPRAGHRRRATARSRSPSSSSRRCRSSSSTAAGSRPARQRRRAPPGGCWSPATAPPRGSACRCPAGTVAAVRRGRRRPADPDRRGLDRATARSARMSRSSSARRPGVTCRRRGDRLGPRAGKTMS